MTHIDDIFVILSEIHDLKASKVDFLCANAYKNYEKWKLFMLLHIKIHFEDTFHAITSKVCESGPFWCNDMKSRVFVLIHKKCETCFKTCKWLQKVWFCLSTHFKICNALQKVRFCIKTYIKTCNRPQKVQFYMNTYFKICNGHENVLFWEENAFLLSKNPIWP